MDGESATARVFNIGELLECILMFLPCKDALIVQRVAKSRKATIAASPSLQKGLFLVPAAETGDGLGTLFAHDVPRATMAEWFDITELLSRKDRQRVSVGAGDPVTTYRFVHAPHSVDTAHSIYHTFAKAPERPIIMNPLIPSVYEPFKDQKDVAFAINSGAFLKCKHPRWRDMFLSKPPITSVRVAQIPTDVICHHAFLRTGFFGERDERVQPVLGLSYRMQLKEHTVRRRSGITLGEVVEFMKDRYGGDDGERPADGVIFFYARLGTS
jgi:hypothetical protein